MAINKLTFDGGLNTAKDASALNYLLGDGEFGILEGVEKQCSCSYSGNTVTIAAGIIMIYGRAIKIDEGTQVTIPINSTAYGYVILKVDLSNESVVLTYKEGPAYPTLIQNNLQTDIDGIFEFPIAQYLKTTTNVSFNTIFAPAFIKKSNSVYQRKLSTGTGLSIINDTIFINYNIVQEKLNPKSGIMIEGTDIFLDPSKTFTKVFEGMNSGNLFNLFRNNNDTFIIISDIDKPARFWNLTNITNKKTIFLAVADTSGNVKAYTISDSLLPSFTSPVLMKKRDNTSISFSCLNLFTSLIINSTIFNNATCDFTADSNLSLIADANFRIYRLT